MNVKNYFIITLSVLILVPAMVFSSDDHKDGDRTQPQPSAAPVQPAAQPAPQPPFRAVNPNQQPDARSGNDLEDEIDEYFDVVNSAPRAQALPAQPSNNNCWATIKSLAATGAGCLVGAFCGHLIKEMWANLHTGGLLEVPATFILAVANHEFADSIGGSAPLADIAMITSAVVSANPYSVPVKKNKYAGGIYIRGGGVIVA